LLKNRALKTKIFSLLLASPPPKDHNTPITTKSLALYQDSQFTIFSSALQPILLQQVSLQKQNPCIQSVKDPFKDRLTTNKKSQIASGSSLRIKKNLKLSAPGSTENLIQPSLPLKNKYPLPNYYKNNLC
jgi:hypothetical protein